MVGGVLLVTMLFFSALAFTVLENAMSVIFFHRVAIRRRHFLVSAVMPYVFILFLGLGLLVTTIVSGVLQFVGARDITVWGQAHSLDQLSAVLLYLVGVTGNSCCSRPSTSLCPLDDCRCDMRCSAEQRPPCCGK